MIWHVGRFAARSISRQRNPVPSLPSHFCAKQKDSWRIRPRVSRIPHHPAPESASASLDVMASLPLLVALLRTNLPTTAGLGHISYPSLRASSEPSNLHTCASPVNLGRYLSAAPLRPSHLKCYSFYRKSSPPHACNSVEHRQLLRPSASGKMSPSGRITLDITGKGGDIMAAWRRLGRVRGGFPLTTWFL